MKPLAVCGIACALLMYQSASVIAQRTPQRFPWVYLIQHYDHWQLFTEDGDHDEHTGPDCGWHHWELSVNALNASTHIVRIRVHAFDSFGQDVYSVQAQIGPGLAGEAFHWHNCPSLSLVPNKQVRVVVISSERPLHVDAAAAFWWQEVLEQAPYWFTIKSKRDVPVKEINCPLEASRFGWACSVAATYPPGVITPR